MATKKTSPFRTILDAPAEKKYSNAGEQIEEVWSMRLDENGKEEFYISGKTNIYERNQADLENTKIENIMAKVMNTGDMSLLQQSDKIYADLTEMPKNIIEVKNRLNEAEKTFNELPANIREEYNNNFNEYLADVGSEKWTNLMFPKETEEIVEEIAKEESEE